MKTVKDKLYNFEQEPPDEIWTKLNSRLSETKVVTINARRSQIRLIAFSSAAAAIVILVLISIFYNPKSQTENNFASQQNNQSRNKMQKDSAKKNYEALTSIIKTPQNKKLLAVKEVSTTEKLKYITISGPDGEPVKISPKVATLIISADNENPPKPTWSRQINKWQKIMLSNSITPTSANLMDIIQKASNSLE